LGKVIWFTGLSGAGKSTLANELYKNLKQQDVKNIEILDGDEIRTNLSKGLGFSREDRDANIRRIGYVAKLLSRNDVTVIVAAISPYREVREELRRNIPDFLEIYCKCPLSVVQQRDPKGLYKKVAAGEIKNFTGIDDPYEEPMSPDLTLDTDKETLEKSLSKILYHLGFKHDVNYII